MQLGIEMGNIQIFASIDKARSFLKCEGKKKHTYDTSEFVMISVLLNSNVISTASHLKGTNKMRYDA